MYLMFSHLHGGPARLHYHHFHLESLEPKVRGVCVLLRVLQSDSGTGGVGSQAQLGCKFPSLLGMSSALIRKAALPWACWGQGQTHSLCLLGFAIVLGPLLGFKVTISRNQLCSPDFNLSRQCRLATILQ